MFKPEQLLQLRTIEEIHALPWNDFEWFCKYFLEYLGYERVCRTKKNEYGADGGIDITCYQKDEKILVQCKQWTNGSHGFLQTRVIFEHAGYMKFYEAEHGIVMTCLELSSMDKGYAKKLNILPIGRQEIARHMATINPNFKQ